MPQSGADTAQLAPPRTHDQLLARYRELRQQHQSHLDALSTRQRRALMLIVAVILVILYQTAASLHGGHAAWPMLLTFAAVVALIVILVRLQNQIAHIRRLVAFYDACLLRADGAEPHTALTGEDAIATPGHIYERDLDVTGPQSLFSLLATVRTGIGERGLARYLLMPATHEESVLRQQAVRELLPQTALREQISLLGASSFQQLSGSFFDTWLDAAPPLIHIAFRYALATTSAAAIAVILTGLFRIRQWSDLLPNLLAILALQGAIALLIRKRVAPLLEGGARLQGQVRLFSEGLALLQNTQFTSPKLIELQRLSREPAGAVKLLKQLDGYLVIVQQRTKELFFVFSLLTAAGCQTAISISRWKLRHAPAMRLWLTAWAEFEALNALATYAFEHPEDAWPELLPPSAPPTFEARTLGHPLLPNSVCNDIALGPQNHFFLISGSNMAGKSTLMRSIGVAAVLAYAGAPVRAASLRLSPFTVGASIALVDSLAEGKSKFRAEVERLAAIVTFSRTQPVLFLVDEIFSGTNSLDRRTAAAAVLNRLLTNGAIGALSTHDLALTSLATDENHGLNVHMASPDPADPLAFDYILKPGINQSSNALAIIRLIGLDA
jgi:low affinity Fe/Cu permease